MGAPDSSSTSGGGAVAVGVKVGTAVGVFVGIGEAVGISVGRLVAVGLVRVGVGATGATVSAGGGAFVSGVVHPARKKASTATPIHKMTRWDCF